MLLLFQSHSAVKNDTQGKSKRRFALTETVELTPVWQLSKTALIPTETAESGAAA